MSTLCPANLISILSLSDKNHVVLALSGGMDSMVLLDLLSKARSVTSFSLSAVYVNHGLSPHANEWAQFCESECQKRDIKFKSETVQLVGLDNLELKAREARYKVLAKSITTPLDILVTAHHGDDQVESLFLALKRGSGLAGLSGIASERSFSAGVLKRPLLGFSQQDLTHYAKENALCWVEDESNADVRFERNYIRKNIAPVLTKRWPTFVATTVRSMAHVSNAQTLLDFYTEEALNVCSNDNVLSITKLSAYHIIQQDLVIRAWLKRFSLNPEQQWLNTLKNEVINAKEDATPVLICADYQVRRFNNALYLLTEAELIAPSFSLQWQGEQNIAIPDMGSLVFSSTKEQDALALNVGSATLCFGKLSLRFKPAGSLVSKPLKQWFKLWQIPPWQRQQLPLLVSENEIVAVIGVASNTVAENAKMWCYWNKP